MVKRRIKEVLLKLIPYRILHWSTIKLKDQEIQKQKEVAREALEDKKHWREAYFTKKKYEKPRSSPGY